MAVMNSEMWNEGGSDQGGVSRDDILTVVGGDGGTLNMFLCTKLVMFLDPIISNYQLTQPCLRGHVIQFTHPKKCR